MRRSFPEVLVRGGAAELGTRTAVLRALPAALLAISFSRCLLASASSGRLVSSSLLTISPLSFSRGVGLTSHSEWSRMSALKATAELVCAMARSSTRSQSRPS